MCAKKAILFLCTGNSCRSQMAEGWAKHLKGSSLKAFSAGIVQHGVDPVAVKVMAEVGIDISKQKSKLITELQVEKFDFIVTVCDQANENCPVMPEAGKVINNFFLDPPTLASKKNTASEKLECYREVRDLIRDFIKNLPENLL